MDRLLVIVLSCSAVGVLAYPWLWFGSDAGPVSYVVLAAAAASVGWVALVRRRPVRPLPWVMLLLGHTAWVAGDVLFLLETQVWRLEVWPAWSDVLYLSGYGFLVVGALHLVRSRRQQKDVTAILDAAIVTVGVAVPTVAFVVLPAATDVSVTLLGKLVSTAYPVGDLAVLAVLARLAVTPGARTRAFQLLVASLSVTLVTDAAWNIMAISGGYADVSRWMDVGWLAGYVLVAAAVLSPDMVALSERPPDREAPPTRSRLVALALASTLPCVTLMVDGAGDGDTAWVVVGAGGILLSLLVLARMAGLLGQVQVQAVQLAAIARLDALTGAPNRRTWDLELSRAVAEAAESGRPLSVALLDLDHFKRYNDTHGHQQGDQLLREAVAAWTEAVGEGRLLARYGGEEFALLLPGVDVGVARQVLETLRPLTPSGQTFSAGVARWQPGSDPGAAVAAADEALYVAKRRGRDQVAVSGDPTDRELPDWAEAIRCVVQPVVEAASGTVVGHEALSRFPHSHDVVETFRTAHGGGYGDLLELEAVRRALALPGRPAGQLLFVNASAAALGSDRFTAGLPGRLDGVVVELVEDDRTTDWTHLAPVLADLRRRGAWIAVDDLGAGSGDLARVIAVRPDIIKLDRGIVTGCGTDPVRRDVVAGVLTIARATGARVCAEGIETADDLDALVRLGVDLVQGYFLGRPAERWAAGATVPGRGEDVIAALAT